MMNIFVAAKEKICFSLSTVYKFKGIKKEY